MRRAIPVLSTCFLLALAPPALRAQLEVGSGATFDVGTGTLDLGCTGLVAAGGLDVGAGSVSQALDVSIVPGGTLDGGAGALEVSGDWSNAGTFTAGSGTVRFVDACGPGVATITGASTFNDLEMTTLLGKVYELEAGVTQTVHGLIALAGASAESPLLLRSTSSGSEAFLDATGGQSLLYLDVQDNHATGAPMQAPGSVDSGNTQGWVFSAAVPALPVVGTLVLAASLVWRARARLRSGGKGQPAPQRDRREDRHHEGQRDARRGPHGWDRGDQDLSSR